jgi:fluoride exporter
VIYLWLGVGGAIGTVARYALSGWIDARFGANPLGIFVVNITGAFLIGLVMAVTEDRFLIPAQARQFITIGLFGGFTTFSTLTYETMRLLETGSFATAMLNIVGSLMAGLVAVYAGMSLGRVF